VFTWQVTALNVQGKPVGFAGPFTFEKPLPPPKAGPNGRAEAGFRDTRGGGGGDDTVV